ncbi:hypothetical protein TYRP_003979 [Tyrophagus putrescentiae]|nr:hypothetical protein TYRP_003979 [Tyrophagus putrescentiae]
MKGGGGTDSEDWWPSVAALAETAASSELPAPPPWHSSGSVRIPKLGGINLSIIFFACSGHSFVSVCRSSLSAWSISSAGRILMLRFSRMSAKSVVVKFTLPSSVTGMFMRISFL